jgi:hypothetical protein
MGVQESDLLILNIQATPVFAVFDKKQKIYTVCLPY